MEIWTTFACLFVCLNLYEPLELDASKEIFLQGRSVEVWKKIFSANLELKLSKPIHSMLLLLLVLLLLVL